MLFNSFGPENEIFRESVLESDRVVKQLFAQCERRTLLPGGFGAQLYQADEGRATQAQASAPVRSILCAGFDTALGNAVYAFATNLARWQVLRSDPARLRSAFRREAPVHLSEARGGRWANHAGLRTNYLSDSSGTARIDC
jgi:4-methoxybenzoate monooxygenase (O-demethylating)